MPLTNPDLLTPFETGPGSAGPVTSLYPSPNLYPSPTLYPGVLTQIAGVEVDDLHGQVIVYLPPAWKPGVDISPATSATDTRPLNRQLFHTPTPAQTTVEAETLVAHHKVNLISGGSANSGGVASTNVPLTFPTHTINDTYLVAIALRLKDGAGGIASFPSTFTRIGLLDLTPNGYLALFRGTAATAGAESGTWVLSQSDFWTASIVVLRGADVSSPIVSLAYASSSTVEQQSADVAPASVGDIAVSVFGAFPIAPDVTDSLPQVGTTNSSNRTSVAIASSTRESAGHSAIASITGRPTDLNPGHMSARRAAGDTVLWASIGLVVAARDTLHLRRVKLNAAKQEARLKATPLISFPTLGSKPANGVLWEIARLPGNDRSSADILDTSIIGRVPWTMRTFIDRRPQGGPATYFVRLRTQAVPERFTRWVAVGNADPPTPLREETESPFNVLELSADSNSGFLDNIEASVETSQPYRFNIPPGSPSSAYLEMTFDYRASVPAPTTPDGTRIYAGFRFYDRTNHILQTTFATILLVDNTDPDNPYSIAGNYTYRVQPPSGASTYSIFFQFADVSSFNNRCRIENVELYRLDTERDTLWEYVQIPNSQGIHVDQQFTDVDQTAFTYDGVGWSALTGSPTTAGATSPYRESSTPQDSVTFITSGAWMDMLLYGFNGVTHVALSRLVDSAAAQTLSPDASLWEIVEDATSPGATQYWSNNLATDSYTNKPSADPLKDNFIDPAATGTAAMVESSGVWSLKPKDPGEGAAMDFGGALFQAGQVYRLSIDVARLTGVDTQVSIRFGATQRYAPGAIYATYYNDDTADEMFFDLAAGFQTITLIWRPRTDTQSAWMTLVNETSFGSYGVNGFTWKNVVVQQLLGLTLPAADDFKPITISAPGLFSPRASTAYQLTLLDGTVRPYGVRREEGNFIDVTQNFAPVLRALGDLRNASFGELDFDASDVPKMVLHYTRRGKDNSQLEGGLDLRFGRNLTTKKRAVDTTNLANRVIVIGYGSNQTQLIQEARSLIDVQGRVPSDPEYRMDANGLFPGDPDWDRVTGGTSEDIFGPRYGTYTDSTITSRYTATELSQGIAETSAWPAETYEITVVDLETIPQELEPGDLVLIRYGDRDLLRRIIDFTYDIGKPRELQLTLGENQQELSASFARVQRDLQVAMSFLNNSSTTSGSDPITTGSA